VAWFKVDDGLHSSRKVLQIPRRQRWAAEGLWVHAGSWASDNLTDGHIPDYIIVEWAPPKSAVEALVNVGLWDRTHDGFEFRNWSEYQPSKAEVDAERDANRARQKAFRDRLKHKKLLEHAEHEAMSHVTNALVTEPRNGHVMPPRPDPTRPDPTITKDSSKTDEEFDRWYAMYPRKEAKAAAQKAFTKVRKNADIDTLMAGLERYVKSVKGTERKYIALPASWLNAGRWEDEVVDQLPSGQRDQYWWANQ
jgi:hypothetical protein